MPEPVSRVEALVWIFLTFFVFLNTASELFHRVIRTSKGSSTFPTAHHLLHLQIINTLMAEMESCMFVWCRQILKYFKYAEKAQLQLL